MVVINIHIFTLMTVIIILIFFLSFAILVSGYYFECCAKNKDKKYWSREPWTWLCFNIYVQPAPCETYHNWTLCSNSGRVFTTDGWDQEKSLAQRVKGKQRYRLVINNGTTTMELDVLIGGCCWTYWSGCKSLNEMNV